MDAMVEAVPIVMQWPGERDMALSAAMKSCCDMTPARTSSENFQTSVPEPIVRPLKRPFNIGPPEMTIEGRSQEAAPITSDGVVLSQPAMSTTPSIGLPRIASSTSIEARLRKSMAVGRRLDSPQENTGNSSGRPPASSTPALMCSTSPRKCALQGVSSEKVLQMPITGRPSKTSSGNPLFFIQLR